MKLSVHPSESRGSANHGWLKTRYSFSFSNYYHPDRIHFGALRVLNDDVIARGMGFGTHPHDNMEIITIVLVGELEHRDSMGNGSVIRPGEVLVMSAGTGIQHSEFNHSKENEVSLIQIWIFPDKKNVTPRYGQSRFDDSEMNGKWRTIVSPEGVDQSLFIHQQAWLSMGYFEAGTMFTYFLKRPGNKLFVFVISGETEIERKILNERDALCVEDIECELEMKVGENSKILVIEIPE